MAGPSNPTACKACIVDYTIDSAEAFEMINDCSALVAAMQAREPRQARLIIVEDPSCDVVGTLREIYDIDPLFFLSHTEHWVELPNPDIDAGRMSHFTLEYLRARYFENEAAFDEAEYQSGDLKGASVALSRARTSLWVKPKKNDDELITAILLVDPIVIANHNHPVWGSYRPFTATPTMEMVKSGYSDAPERVTLFDDIVNWSSRMTEDDIKRIGNKPRYIALPMYKLVIADWMAVLKHMTTMLAKIECEFEGLHWGENPSDIHSLFCKVLLWRRNVACYQTWINEAIAQLFPPEVRAPLHGSPGNDGITIFMLPHGDIDQDVFSLWTDFQIVKRQMDNIQRRVHSIENTARNAISIEESRRAVNQNKTIARLTFLATIFIPLSFISRFLSIPPDFSTAYQSVLLFFVIGIPLTISALLVVDFSNPGGESLVRRKRRNGVQLVSS